MKVCTDACILGALVAGSIAVEKEKYVLDIGTGTGLLSLMYAQKNHTAKIQAVEMEENAFLQAKENFSTSPWNQNLQLFHADIKKFKPGITFHLVISNPPFFENELLSSTKVHNLAKHHQGLRLQELAALINIHLGEKGIAAVLLPFQRIQYFEQLMLNHGLLLTKKVLVKQTPSHNHFRGILFFRRDHNPVTETELTIQDKEGNYTGDFKELMQDYYLHL